MKKLLDENVILKKELVLYKDCQNEMNKLQEENRKLNLDIQS